MSRLPLVDARTMEKILYHLGCQLPLPAFYEVEEGA